VSRLTKQYYKKNHIAFIEQYNAVSFEFVHKGWLEYLPKEGCSILDIGAGSGRDVLWLHNHGYLVTAIEPVVEFIQQFKKISPHVSVNWIMDTLPLLHALMPSKPQFDLILLSAVWMHLTEHERKITFQTLSILNRLNSILVMSLRYGESPDERRMYPVSIQEIELLAKKNHYKILSIKQSRDKLRRDNVEWKTIILQKE